jgi:hypothetical protein
MIPAHFNFDDGQPPAVDNDAVKGAETCPQENNNSQKVNYTCIF